MPTPEELLAAYVEAHNGGVRTADFETLGALLHPTATMRFRGVPAGPYDSAAAILQAFRESAPTDELVVAGVRRVDEHAAVATYAWSGNASRSAGRLRITKRGDLISAILVEAFD